MRRVGRGERGGGERKAERVREGGVGINGGRIHMLLAIAV